MTTKAITKLLNQYHIYPDKKRGQNFLVDESYIDQMIETGKVSDKDLVIEIGPGLGVLTKALANKADQILSIEIDKKLSSYLRASVQKQYNNITIIEGDALSKKVFHQSVDWLYHQITDEPHSPFEHVVDPHHESYNEVLDSLDRKYKLIANLPYQITSKILRQFLESLPRPSNMVVMVQKEVGQRMTAPPGKMSLLSLSTQAYSTAKMIDIVPSKAFYPPPQIDSAIVHCDLMEPNKAYQALDDQEMKLFWRLAKAGFSSRRKQLKNNLAVLLSDLSDEEIADHLKTVGLSSTVRAQELAVEDWCRLATDY